MAGVQGMRTREQPLAGSTQPSNEGFYTVKGQGVVIDIIFLKDVEVSCVSGSRFIFIF